MLLLNIILQVSCPKAFAVGRTSQWQKLYHKKWRFFG
jgi:hypothetical protein